MHTRGLLEKFCSPGRANANGYIDKSFKFKNQSERFPETVYEKYESSNVNFRSWIINDFIGAE